MSTNIVLIHRSGGDFRIADAYLLVTHIRKYWENENIQPNNYAWQPRKIYFDLCIDDRNIPAQTWQLYMDDLEQFKRQSLKETK